MDPSAKLNDKRKEEFKNLATIVLTFVVVPVLLQAVIIDIYAGTHLISWTLISLIMAFFSVISSLLYKLEFLKRHPGVPIVLFIFTYTLVLLYNNNLASEQNPFFIHTYIPLMFGLSIFPWITRQFLLFFTSVNVIYFGYIGYFAPEATESHFSILIHAKTYLVISFLIFFVLNKLRNAYYLKSIALEETISNRERTIQEQTKKLTETQVAAKIGKATQMIVHDIRKPFHMIECLILMLKNSKNRQMSEEKVDSYATRTQSAIANINQMLEDVLTISKRDVMTTKVTDAEISRLFYDSLGTVFHQNIHKQFKLDLKNNQSLPVRVDLQKIDRVFQNILINAIEAMPKSGGVIWVNWNTVDAQYAKIEIGNSGSAIPEVDLENIFEAFHTKNKSGGTGLGLSICKSVIEAHGGEIYCKSSNHEGTKFIFTLPLSRNKDAFKKVANSDGKSIEFPKSSFEANTRFNIVRPRHF